MGDSGGERPAGRGRIRHGCWAPVARLAGAPPRAWGAFGGVLLALWLAGELVCDRTWLTGLCFYVPSPVYALGLGGAAVMAWRRGGRRVAAGLALAAAVPAAFCVAVEHQWRAPEASAGASPGAPVLRAVHWNIFYGKMGWRPILEELLEADADVYVLSEVWPTTPLGRLGAVFGEAYGVARADNLVVIARGRLSVPERLAADGARVYAVDWTLPEGGDTLRLLLVDLPSSLLRKRDPALRRVIACMEAEASDVVLGDFNSPRRSRALRSLPPGYGHAYWQAGAGWSYTWPVPAPVLAIDQCIAGPRIDTVRYRLESSWASDHRRQVLEFRVREAPPG
ncbi:MAG: hypothetical protein JXR94_17190 [Candidatus Hydrogenedentes bacterium]|nr:hypothetical protein [Candidatus Hydrogenedentota bacterium]